MYSQENMLDFSKFDDEYLLSLYNDCNSNGWDPTKLSPDGPVRTLFSELIKTEEWAGDPFGHCTGWILGSNIQEAIIGESARRYWQQYRRDNLFQ